MSEPPPVEAVAAATVILVRDAPGGWECFMVRRHVRSEFAADVFVFPGGKVDPADRELGKTFAPGDLPVAPDGMPPDGTWAALTVAALRELFEESGVLLAQRGGEHVSLTGAEAERFEDYRARVHRGDMTLAGMVETEGLRLLPGALVPFSHWITPLTSPRRYDTWFFLARMPRHQVPLHDERETVDSRWIAPAEALAAYGRGVFPLVFATEKQLERMARFDSLDALLSGIRAGDLAAVMPRPVIADGEKHFLLPGDPDY